MNRTDKYKKVYMACLALKKRGDRICPQSAARESGYGISARISAQLKALEIDGLIRRIHHTWHDVEIEVLGK